MPTGLEPYVIELELPAPIADVQKKVAAFVAEVVLPAEAELGADPEVAGESFDQTLARLRDEARSAEATGRNVDALDWYRVLAAWKLALLLEGSYARHLAGATDDPFCARMEAGVPALALRGRAVAGI